MNVINVFGAAERYLGEHGGLLTCRQIRVLAYATVNPGVTTSLHADALGISRPAVTRSVDRLVEAGLVTRTGDPDDRRKVKVTATTVGREVIEKIVEAGRG